ncbi:U11/U12 small nuclear ribonucleoprotein 25 kDa protein-like [Aphidius gifuensis]|uniref:U11/U12 small nuclear ribonucleoprotein 25 kDa protein-like n=1 Tax=Aphidius gifuensis TaxID=684658 RepID=UPI001CDD14CA|nr:U11/U12 small nuclear ribonucleoprotein 25 kDa protein-like [Aphidius gifuensis]
MELSTSDESENQQQFNHDDLVKLTKDAIEKIIESDPLFSGLHGEATIDEIKAQTAVAQGQAITLYLNRGKLSKLSIVVAPNNTTINDLKKSIKRQTNLSLIRKNIIKKISWKSVWKKYDLCFDDVVLDDDNENIKTYGISNRTELHYKKKIYKK